MEGPRARLIMHQRGIGGLKQGSAVSEDSE